MDKWKTKILRVKVEKYDYDPREDDIKDESYVEKAIKYRKNTNDYIYQIGLNYGLYLS